MYYIKIFLFVLCAGSLFGQASSVYEDYQFYARKEPLTTGSGFGALGAASIMINPANIALITDNQISSGWVQSEVGYGYFISWVAPNFSIANAQQTNIADDDLIYDFKKSLLQFNFGLSTVDLGMPGESFLAALGVNVKRVSDNLNHEDGTHIYGWNATAFDAGLLIKIRRLIFEIAVQDLNQPAIDEQNFTYYRGYLAGIRYENGKGLKLSFQGVGGDRYKDMDFGLNIAAEQSFFERRLLSRVQLTSYYAGSKAKMQNLCGSVGYRFSSKGRSFFILKDLELSYTLSMLTLPRNIGTHMLVITKYF